MTKAAKLRQALAGSRPVQAIGAHDGLGARLAEEAGFDAVWASGLEISTSAAVPDANILSMTQFLSAATEMDQATRIPVIADCDTGFGNSNNVIHMVKSYEAAGIAAVCMEDKLFPKVNSFVPGRQELAPIAEFVGKVMAAKSAQRSDDFLLIARVEALIAGWGMEEALRRAEAYQRAGADAILMHSKQKTPDEILAFLRLWDHRSPVVVVPTTYPQLTAGELKAAGADLVIYANHGLRAAIGAMERTYREILEHEGTMTVVDGLVPMTRVFELQGMVAMKEDERRFLRGEARPVRVIVPAGGDLDLPADLAALASGPGSRALLDVYGKPLVERQLDAFAQAGVHDVSLVGPFARADVSVPGLALVHAEAPSLLGTVLAGLRAAPCPAGGTTLVCYSDILFGRPVVERLLGCRADVALLVDRAFLEAARPRHKRLDLLITDPAPQTRARVLDVERGLAVQAVGKQVAPSEAHFEFIGLASFSEAGCRAALALCDRRERECPEAPFGEAPDFASATLTDLFAELIEAGQPVLAFEQDRGWMEIHDFEDYKAATAQLARE